MDWAFAGLIALATIAIIGLMERAEKKRRDRYRDEQRRRWEESGSNMPYPFDD